MSVCESVLLSVCTSVCPQKNFFDFNEVWHVGRGRWVMHDGMQYDQIQGQGHEPFRVANLAIFQKLSSLPFTKGASKWPGILNLIGSDYLLVLVFCVMWLWTGQKCRLPRVNCQSRTMLSYLYVCMLTVAFSSKRFNVDWTYLLAYLLCRRLYRWWCWSMSTLKLWLERRVKLLRFDDFFLNFLLHFTNALHFIVIAYWPLKTAFH